MYIYIYIYTHTHTQTYIYVCIHIQAHSIVIFRLPATRRSSLQRRPPHSVAHPARRSSIRAGACG